MHKIWLISINKIDGREPSSDKRMEGQLKGLIFRCNDGYKYYKHSSNRPKTKLYYQCAKYSWGKYRVSIQTENTDKYEKNLRVIHRNEVHNYPAPLGDSRSEPRRRNSSTSESSNISNLNQQNLLPASKCVVYVYQ